MADAANGPSRPISKIWAFFKSAYQDGPKSGLTQFKNEWALLSEKEKDDISNGIVNGTLTY